MAAWSQHIDDSTSKVPAVLDGKLFMLDLAQAGICEFQQGCHNKLALDHENFLFI